MRACVQGREGKNRIGNVSAACRRKEGEKERGGGGCEKEEL